MIPDDWDDELERAAQVMADDCAEHDLVPAD